MSIRNVPVQPHSPRLHVGGPLLVALLLVLGIAIVLVILQQRMVAPEQQAVPTAGQAIQAVPAARDQWWLDQPAQPAVPAARDQWWLDQPTVAAPARDQWWLER